MEAVAERQDVGELAGMIFEDLSVDGKRELNNHLKRLITTNYSLMESYCDSLLQIKNSCNGTLKPYTLCITRINTDPYRIDDFIKRAKQELTKKNHLKEKGYSSRQLDLETQLKYAAKYESRVKNAP